MRCQVRTIGSIDQHAAGIFERHLGFRSGHSAAWLAPDQVLVLVNGKRRHTNAVMDEVLGN
jgi:threonyl-tRNA synthetase